MNKTDLVAIRDFVAADWNFILATWLRGLYYGKTWFSEIPKDIFMEKYHAIIEAILGLKNVIVKVACLKDDPEVILGYAIMSEDRSTVHFTFVKSAWRGIGIAKSLIPPEMKQVTHLTKVGLSILKSKYPGVQFNPFAIN